MKKLTLFILIIISLISCHKKEDRTGEQEKIYLYNNSDVVSTTNKNGEIIGIIYRNFNIEHYEGCVSIKLIGYISTDVMTDACIVNIYDLSHDKIIDDSKISINFKSGGWVKSKNFINELNTNDIDLSLQLKSYYGNKVNLIKAYLLIEY